MTLSAQQGLELPPGGAAGRRFVVARNPDPDSSLPYLLRVPVGAGLTLKAREPWPLSSRVYCHPADPAVAAADVEVLEEVPVRACGWRGRAVDLVLDRPRHNTSQFVFTTARGRPAIFWQTAEVARGGRGGAGRGAAQGARAARGDSRVRLAAAGSFVIEVDTRQQQPYAFAGRGAGTLPVALPAGDYAVRGRAGVIAAVERRTAADFITSACSGGLAFAMADLAAVPAAAVVVEERLSRLIASERVRAGFLADLIARLQVRCPTVPIVFAENRGLAEDWTFRFLATAWREAGSG